MPEHWVFAYGSLMWDPGFEVAECVTAQVDGYARRFCMQSVVYRGTEENPGLVLALDHENGAVCTGLALRVAATDWPETLAGLRERELATHAYSEEMLPISLRDGRRVEAIGYVMRRDHCQYVGGLSLADQARIIAGATGGRGPNADYLFNTTRHLAQIGVSDEALAELAQRVQKIIDTKA
ncbi:gamma-glutamylcyclotransferase [Paracoccus aminophilus]|nr:gamma-glutamylcyclotransferase [Paracoccus aminophilus]